jgi:putative transposase
MPAGLKRYSGHDYLHFLTCSCYHRQPWLANPGWRDLFLQIFEEARQRYQFVVVGYVVMPDHIHLLISEPETGTPSTVMQVVKQRFARRVLEAVRNPTLAENARVGHPEVEVGHPDHVWQKRFYDFHVWSERKRIEKLRYMHRNPVKEGLVREPEHWLWSSYRSYAYDEPGMVKINQWPKAELRKRPAA